MLSPSKYLSLFSDTFIAPGIFIYLCLIKNIGEDIPWKCRSREAVFPWYQTKEKRGNNQIQNKLDIWKY